MVVCVECLPADKTWDVVSVTRRSSGVAPRACVRVYARVLVPPNLYIHTYTRTGEVYYYSYNSYDETSKLRHGPRLLEHPTPLLRALGLALRWGVTYSLVTDYC